MFADVSPGNSAESMPTRNRVCPGLLEEDHSDRYMRLINARPSKIRFGSFSSNMSSVRAALRILDKAT